MGWVNGVEYNNEEDYVLAKTGRDHIITDDAELIEYARKVTSDWYEAGWSRTFTSFYLSDYALDRPRCCLTRREFARLKELQAEAIKREQEAEDARGWRFLYNCYFADNSVEEIWEDKDGNRKTVMAVAPHGDVC